MTPFLDKNLKTIVSNLETSSEEIEGLVNNTNTFGDDISSNEGA